MKRYLAGIPMIAVLLGAPAMADDQSLDAAVGGAVGGGLGAFIGNELGGRPGAITGGALGAAAGAAVTTDDYRRYGHPGPAYYGGYPPYGPGYRYGPPGPPGRFCPPGQAKKGRCW
jgi:hypothetical protein